MLLLVIARYRDLKVSKFFRGDAAFATPKLMKLLEAEGYGYAIRLKGKRSRGERDKRIGERRGRTYLTDASVRQHRSIRPTVVVEEYLAFRAFRRA